MVLRRCMLLCFISRCLAALSVLKLFTDFRLGLRSIQTGRDLATRREFSVFNDI
jgi:hypothetical protein